MTTNTATVSGSQRQKTEIAVTMHRAGKDVVIVPVNGKPTHLSNRHTYTVKHRDTFSRIFRDDSHGQVHAQIDGNEKIRISGSELDL